MVTDNYLHKRKKNHEKGLWHYHVNDDNNSSNEKSNKNTQETYFGRTRQVMSY